MYNEVENKTFAYGCVSHCLVLFTYITLISSVLFFKLQIKWKSHEYEPNIKFIGFYKQKTKRAARGTMVIF